MKWDFLKNPIVVMAGIGIGLLILLTRGSSSNSGASVEAAVGAFERNNMAAMSLAQSIAQIDVSRQIALSDNNTDAAIAAMQSLTALSGARLQVAAQIEEAAAGERMARIKGRFDVAMQDADNRSRFAMGQLEQSTILKSLMIENGKNPNAIDQPVTDKNSKKDKHNGA